MLASETQLAIGEGKMAIPECVGDVAAPVAFA